MFRHLEQCSTFSITVFVLTFPCRTRLSTPHLPSLVSLEEPSSTDSVSSILWPLEVSDIVSTPSLFSSPFTSVLEASISSLALFWVSAPAFYGLLRALL